MVAVLPLISYVLGLSVYVVVGKFSSIKKTLGKQFGTQDFKLEAGLIMGLCIVGLNLFLFLFCFFKTKNSFIN